MKKYTFLTGTGPGNQILVTEKDTYTWLEFSNKEDMLRFVASTPNAERKNTQVKRQTVQNDDLSWSHLVIETYPVIVRK